MADTGGELIYEGTFLRDLVTRKCEWTAEVDAGVVLRKERHKQWPLPEILPEEIMSALEQYTGDAGARVTVGGELADSKEFGNAAKAFVSISVTCNNSLEDCGAVHDLLQPVVRELINSDLDAMWEDRDNALAARNNKKVEPKAPGVVKAPAGKPTQPQPSQARPLPKKPSFRR